MVNHSHWDDEGVDLDADHRSEFLVGVGQPQEDHLAEFTLSNTAYDQARENVLYNHDSFDEAALPMFINPRDLDLVISPTDSESEDELADLFRPNDAELVVEAEETSMDLEQDIAASQMPQPSPWQPGTPESNLADTMDIDGNGSPVPGQPAGQEDVPSTPSTPETAVLTPDEPVIPPDIHEHVEDADGPLALTVDEEGEHACPHLHCARRFHTRKQVMNHKKRCPVGKLPRHRCNTCHKLFWYPKDARRCQDKHAHTKVPCGACPRIYSRRDNMIRHMEHEHPGVPVPEAPVVATSSQVVASSSSSSLSSSRPVGSSSCLVGSPSGEVESLSRPVGSLSHLVGSMSGQVESSAHQNDSRSAPAYSFEVSSVSSYQSAPRSTSMAPQAQRPRLSMLPPLQPDARASDPPFIAPSPEVVLGVQASPLDTPSTDACRLSSAVSSQPWTTPLTEPDLFNYDFSNDAMLDPRLRANASDQPDVPNDAWHESHMFEDAVMVDAHLPSGYGYPVQQPDTPSPTEKALGKRKMV